MMITSLPNPEASAADDAEGWTPLYERVVADLRRNGVGDHAPAVGDAFPNLTLPDVDGAYRTLGDLSGRSGLVVSFQRGLWCPYCSLEVKAWSHVLPDLTAAGVTLIIVAGELGDRAAALQSLAGNDATVLCDVDHGAALACGLAFRVEDELRRRYVAHGLDLAEVYGSDSGFLPVPATFLLDQDRNVAFASADPDFRLRPNPRDVAILANRRSPEARALSFMKRTSSAE